MKSHGLKLSAALVVFLSAGYCFSAPETVVKMSAPFSFPATVGVLGGRMFQSSHAIFVCTSRLTGRNIVELSWSLPPSAKYGTISIFTVSGSKIKTFSIGSPSGAVEWDITESKKIGKGVYFASISYGMSKRNLKLVIN